MNILKERNNISKERIYQKKEGIYRNKERTLKFHIRMICEEIYRRLEWNCH